MKGFCIHPCGKNYNVCYEIEKGRGERWVNGELINYNSGNIILYNHDEQVIYHIPYKGIRWMLPGKKSLSLAEQIKKA